MSLSAYFAGLFDGEGTVQVYKQRVSKGVSPTYIGFRVSICNTNSTPLDCLAALFDVKVICRTVGRARPLYEVRFGGCKAREFLEWIEPWVIIKAPQVKLALRYPIMGVGQRLTPEEKLIRESSYHQMHELNCMREPVGCQ